MENDRGRLKAGLYTLDAEILNKLGEDYKSMMHRFDRMEIEEIVREITCGVRNAYPETVMGKVMEENRNMAREWKNMKMEIEQLRQQADTHRENLKAQREENEALRRKIDSLQSKPKIRSGNRRDDVSIEDVKRLIESGMSVKEIADELDTNRQTVYNRLRQS